MEKRVSAAEKAIEALKASLPPEMQATATSVDDVIALAERYIKGRHEVMARDPKSSAEFLRDHHGIQDPESLPPEELANTLGISPEAALSSDVSADGGPSSSDTQSSGDQATEASSSGESIHSNNESSESETPNDDESDVLDGDGSSDPGSLSSESLEDRKPSKRRKTVEKLKR